MLCKSFKIVAPEIFELCLEDINAIENECLVKIEKAAICKADIRYYKGKRSERILGLKYPMSLIHEVYGSVLKDKSGKLQRGDKVVLVPNVVECLEKDNCVYKVCDNYFLGENYCPKAKFCSSNSDGFSKEVVAIKARNVIKIDNSIDGNTAVFCELISVACAAFRRVESIAGEWNEIAVWGDGIVGYIIASVAKNIFNKKVTVIGKHEEKMKMFPSDNYIKINEVGKYSFQNIVESVGGKGMMSAIDSILDVLLPGGTLVLSGVSEEKIEFDTRKILEKGLIVTGTTRSNIEDFKKSVEYLNENEVFRKSIEKLAVDEINIESISDFYHAFEKTCSENILGKHIMNFKF